MKEQAAEVLKLWEGDSATAVQGKIDARREIVIGRGMECDIVVKDAKASRRHCQIRKEGDGFILEDLDSKNGTFVNGERITGPVGLRLNEAFKIGDTMFYLAH